MSGKLTILMLSIKTKNSNRKKESFSCYYTIIQIN